MGYLNPGPVVQVTPNTVALMEQVGTGDVPISGNLLVGTTTDNGARLQVVGSGLTDIADFIMSGGATSLSISSAGNVTINAPTSGVALTVDGFAGSFAGSFIGANAGTGLGLLVQGSYTGAGTVGLVQFQDVNNANGVNILLSGNGATTPNKTIKVSNGAFQITNNAYSVNLINLTDAGALTISGPIGANSVSPPAQQTGWGTPTGTGVIASFPGATATLAQTSQAVATIIAYMKSLGFFGA